MAVIQVCMYMCGFFFFFFQTVFSGPKHLRDNYSSLAGRQIEHHFLVLALLVILQQLWQNYIILKYIVSFLDAICIKNDVNQAFVKNTEKYQNLDFYLTQQRYWNIDTNVFKLWIETLGWCMLMRNGSSCSLHALWRLPQELELL